MPPKNQGINIDITAKQLIVGVAGIFTTLVVLSFVIMNSYVTLTVHQALAAKTITIAAESNGLVIKDNDRKNELNNIKDTQTGNYSLLVTELIQLKSQYFICVETSY